jgi:hypothetical protein
MLMKKKEGEVDYSKCEVLDGICEEHGCCLLLRELETLIARGETFDDTRPGTLTDAERYNCQRIQTIRARIAELRNKSS